MASSADKLKNFIEDVCPDSHLRIETDYGDGFVRLRSDEAERRQAAHDIRSSEDIVIELLRNSRDAEARHIFLATSTEGPKRKIVVIDDGVGIPPALHSLVFEPRVTSKLDTVHMDKWGIHGRGMALYSVSVNTEQSAVAMSDKGIGTSLYTISDTTSLAEKKDQSSFPTVTLDGNRATIRGPHNINRTAVEFALEHRQSLEVYLGSPSEIASTMYALGCLSTTASLRSFTKDLNDVPIVRRFAYASDEAVFAELAEQIGLGISPRNARRILDGQIAPLASLSDRVEAQLVSCASNEPYASDAKNTQNGSDIRNRTKLTVSSKKASLDKAGIKQLESAVSQAYQELAQSYYLQPEIEVKTKVSNGVLHISIPLVELE